MISQEAIAYTKENMYDYDHTLTLNYYPKRIIEKLQEENIDIPQMSLLDLGLGHGYSIKIFEQHFQQIRVLDGDSEIIEMYKKNNQKSEVEIIQTYFEEYETKERFDIIVLGFVLEHVDAPKEIVQKYSGLLKEGGKMFIAVPNAACMNRRIGLLTGYLGDIDELSEPDKQVGHQRLFQVSSLKDLVESAPCLKLVDIEGFYLKPMSTKQMIDLNLSEEMKEAYVRLGKEFPELSSGMLASLEKI